MKPRYRWHHDYGRWFLMPDPQVAALVRKYLHVSVPRQLSKEEIWEQMLNAAVTRVY